MSNKALLQFAREIRAACDKLERALTGVTPALQQTPASKQSEKLCRCGHSVTAHNEHGCTVCAKEGTLGALGCPEFSPKRGEFNTTSSSRKKAPGATEALTLCERKILMALKQHGSRTAKQLAVLTGYSLSGTFNGALTGLRALGYITRTTPIAITESGSDEVGELEPLPKGLQLFEWWCASCSPCEVAVLETLRKSEVPLMPQEVAEATGYSMSGTFNGALTRLRHLNLISGGRGQPLVLAPELKKR